MAYQTEVDDNHDQSDANSKMSSMQFFDNSNTVYGISGEDMLKGITKMAAGFECANR